MMIGPFEIATMFKNTQKPLNIPDHKEFEMSLIDMDGIIKLTLNITTLLYLYYLYYKWIITSISLTK